MFFLSKGEAHPFVECIWSSEAALLLMGVDGMLHTNLGCLSRVGQVSRKVFIAY